jgi:hypothetical protein
VLLFSDHLVHQLWSCQKISVLNIFHPGSYTFCLITEKYSLM